MTGLRSRLILLIGTSLLAAASNQAAAQNAREYDLKVASLYQFARSFTWPEAGGDQFVIGVLGRDPFGDMLNQLEKQRTVGRKKIAVRRFESVEDYVPCHILFISRYAAAGRAAETVEDRLKAALAKTKGTPVLLISDTAEFARKGAMINFVVQQNRIRIEMNPGAAKRAGFKFSPGLATLMADLVKKGVLRIVP